MKDKEKIKFVTPDLELSKSIAVVGSSATLVNSEHGKFIDTFDEVIRFNRAITEGFSQYCGDRETLRVMNNNVFDSAPLGEDWGLQNRFYARSLKNKRILYIGPDIYPFYNRKKCVDDSNEVFLYVYENTKKIKEYYNLSKNPSVGLLTIILLTMSGFKPVCFGFDLEASENRTHYFQLRPPASGMHGFEREIELLRELRDVGAIEIYE